MHLPYFKTGFKASESKIRTREVQHRDRDRALEEAFRKGGSSSFATR